MLINNVYGRFASFFKNYELKEADKYIKRVFPNAEFYLDYEHALVFERIGEDKEIDLDYHTVINGIAYDGTFTNNYNELVKYFDESKAQEKNINDFLEKTFEDKYIVSQKSMLKKIESKDSNFKVKVIKDYCDTITCKQVRSPNAGVIRLDDGRYRYLTERECWRLQGYTDEDFDNAARVNPGKEGCMNSALFDELGELMHAQKSDWCWWKFTQEPKDEAKVFEEYIDVVHFALMYEIKFGSGCYQYEDIKWNYNKLKTDLGFGQAYAFSCVISLTRDDNVLAYVIALGLHLGYSIEEIHKEYIRKNEINKERLAKGY